MSMSNGSYTGKRRRREDGDRDHDLAMLLAFLDAEDALTGIFQVTAARAEQVRGGALAYEDLPALAAAAIEDGDFAEAGALCAAQIDRGEAAPRGAP